MLRLSKHKTDISPMTKPHNYRQIFNFLVQHAQEKSLFSSEEFENHAAQADLLPRLNELLEKEGELYRVKPEILRVRLSDFEALLTQGKKLFSEYMLEVSSSILIYEFFMPLSREDRLREALDNLFYRDTIEQRIREIGFERIRAGLALPAEVADEEISRLVFDLIENTIGGYSIYLVNGRYRADKLASRAEVVNRPFAYGSYIVDETTAIVRFILPVERDSGRFSHGSILEPASDSLRMSRRAELIRWLFLNFFAEALIRVVQNEAEIWLLESGMRSAFYRWVKRDTGKEL
jgi:hypothetical protein